MGASLGDKQMTTLVCTTRGTMLSRECFFCVLHMKPILRGRKTRRTLFYFVRQLDEEHALSSQLTS